MQKRNLHITAPALGTPGRSEAEMFGSIAWLWMHTPGYRDLALHAMSSLVLPPLKAQQFILASSTVDGVMMPVAYMAWANFDADAESRYLENAASVRSQDWSSGDRMWATDWFTPFGHAAEFRNVVGQVLPNVCSRALQHRGNERGLRVMHFRGDNIALSQSKQWWRERPMMAPATNL